MPPATTIESNTALGVSLSDASFVVANPRVHSKTSKPRVHWMVYAFLTCIAYTVYNYNTTKNNRNLWASKITNSVVLGVCAVLYELYLRIAHCARGPTATSAAASDTLSQVSHQNSDHSYNLDPVHQRHVRTAFLLSVVSGLLNCIGITALYISFVSAIQAH